MKTHFSTIYSMLCENNKEYIVKIINEFEDHSYIMMIRKEIDFIQEINDLKPNIKAFPEVLFDLGNGYIMDEFGKAMTPEDNLLNTYEKLIDFLS